VENNGKIRVGIIGLGRLGYRHALSVMRCNSARLLALADPNTQKLAAAVKEFEPSYSFIDYREMLDTEVDAVIVAAPTKYHYDILVDLVHRGKSISMSEKWVI